MQARAQSLACDANPGPISGLRRKPGQSLAGWGRPRRNCCPRAPASWPRGPGCGL